MTNEQMGRYRDRLRALATRVRDTAANLEEGARTAGGQADGGLSNAPMHLGDLGTEVYLQELNATLLENEEFIQGEVGDALDRIDAGTFGRCEQCGKAIPAERLDALPYTPYCTACAQAVQSGKAVNINDGRPQQFPPREVAPSPSVADDELGGTPTKRKPKPKRSRKGPGVTTFTDLEPEQRVGEPSDPHAAGTAGGGTAIGGLAGTNIGNGDPTDELDEATGSGNFDTATEEDDPRTDGYGGPTGGAVGGTPANKRVVGGKTRRGANEAT